MYPTLCQKEIPQRSLPRVCVPYSRPRAPADCRLHLVIRLTASRSIRPCTERALKTFLCLGCQQGAPEERDIFLGRTIISRTINMIDLHKERKIFNPSVGENIGRSVCLSHSKVCNLRCTN
ncbi:hypothetical protein EGW08_000270 [Elysia chlorotica]|uniref:Uncharacterized protein n=1 Tax=Elysia chlorotica TaxID=188477 RepID=A0A433UDT9_ELYCH|nr:hypothetical protein EGW08_000270 [Elysia chlorotica]